MRIIVIDTGARITGFKYTNLRGQWQRNNCNIYQLKGYDLKSKCWKNYDRQLQERYFDINVVSNGELFTTLDKKDLTTFSIHKILTMMKIVSGKFHIVANTRFIRMEFDVKDNVSL